MRGAVLLATIAVLGAMAPAAHAQRVFPEPINSTGPIKHGAAEGASQLADGFRELERRYPGFMKFTTVAQELGDPNALSLGPDGKPSWDKADTRDGLPFYVAIVTDESVPDRDKAYVLLLNAHPAEPCGEEGDPRFLEDLLTWRATEPDHVLDDAAGLYGRPHTLTVRELLKKVKVMFVSTSPDDWYSADSGQADNYNNAGFNENRVAFQDGWVFPPNQALFERGYSSLTQPEGAAVTRYLRKLRDEELGGRPFAVANDQHGPLPESGAIIIHEQGNDPAKVDRVHDYARRLEENMEEVFARYFTGEGTTLSQQAASQAGDVRDFLLRKYTEITGQPVTEKALFLTLEWAEYATAWEHLDYTVVSSWGGWAGSHAGVEADSLSFETACDSQSGVWNPEMYQLFVDNVRAANETGVVYAAQQSGGKRDLAATYDLAGSVGFLETGERVTDRDGNAHPPPLNHPGNPLVPNVTQVPYDVSNTDYFRDLRRIVTTPIVEVPVAKVRETAADSLVVSDTEAVDAAALKTFAENGGNLVLTDGALKLLPAVLGVPGASVKQGFSYLGYSDLVRTHPWTEGLYKRARQMFDPVGLGRPLLMERDQYWPCSTDGSSCDESPTVNSAPVWTVDRVAWEAKGGDVAGTADPSPNRKFGGEGTLTDKVTIGAAKLGKGRVVVFGALLPQASETDEHWFGLNGYTVTIPGQAMLLKALRWEDGKAPPPVTKTCVSRRRIVVTLPKRVRGKRIVRGSVRVAGKRVRVRRVGGRLVALVNLSGQKRTRVAVRVTSITARGKRYTQVRRFRTCVRRASA